VPNNQNSKPSPSFVRCRFITMTPPNYLKLQATGQISTQVEFGNWQYPFNCETISTWQDETARHLPAAPGKAAKFDFAASV
jgi:hypothetical protein